MHMTSPGRPVDTPHDPNGEGASVTMLRTLGELSTHLRRRGYISRSKDVLRRYATKGVRSKSGERVVLRAVKMDHFHYSSEQWFAEFIARLEGK